MSLADIPNQPLPVTLLPGSRLGAYEIISELGRGGMGIVYLAQHIHDKTKVALKALLPQIASNPVAIRRFFREIRATSSLQHPNIVKIYGMGHEKGFHYFAMEYIAGTSLQNYMQREDVSLSAKLGILLKICQALHHAHQNNIIHRDIKPANILISASGEPFLTDFGLAKFVEGVSTLTGSGNVVGTPYYVSPEQIKMGRKIDRRADVYSLGIILYQLLTNTLPFTGDTTLEIYGKIMFQEARRPRDINPQVPAPLENICLKAITKPVFWRYRTTLALATDLENYCADSNRGLRWLRLSNSLARHRTLLSRSLLGMLVGTIFIAGLVIWDKHLRAKPVAVAESRIVQTQRLFDILRKLNMYEQADAAAQELTRQGLSPTFDMVEMAWGANNYAQACAYLKNMSVSEQKKQRQRDYYYGAIYYQLGCAEGQSELASAKFRQASELLVPVVGVPEIEALSRHLGQASFHGLDARATLGMALFYAWYHEPARHTQWQQVPRIMELLAHGQVTGSYQEGMLEWAKGELLLAQSADNPDKARQANDHFTRALQHFPRQGTFYRERAQARHYAHEPFGLIEADCFKALEYAPRNFAPWQTLFTAFLSPREYTQVDDMPDIAYLKFLIVGLKNYSIWLTSELPKPALLQASETACYEKYARSQPTALSPQDRELLLQTFLTSTIPAIRAMAMNGLRNVQQEPSFLQQLQQQLSNEPDTARQANYRELYQQLHQAWARQKWYRLLAQMVQNYYFKKATAPFAAADLGQILYEFADDESPQYTLVIKLLAARLLLDMHTPTACAILHQGLGRELPVAICCALVLTEAGYREPYPILAKAAEAADPVVQALALDSLPTPVDLPPNTGRLLQHGDIPLRLSAARLLWCRQGNRAAGIVLANELTNTVSEYRRYAYRWFWDGSTRAYQQELARHDPQRYRQYQESLRLALRSPSEQLRELAFMMAGFHPEIMASFRQELLSGLQDKSMAIKFVAIQNLMKIGEWESLLPYFLAADTPFAARIAVLHSLYWAPQDQTTPGMDKFYVQGLLPKLDQFLHNWGPEFRFLLLSSLGFFHKADPIIKAALTAILKKYSAATDHYQAYGAIYGCMMLENKSLIAPMVLHNLKHSDVFIQYASAAAISSLVLSCEPEKWNKWRQKIQNKPYLCRGASYGVYFQWQKWGRVDFFWYEQDASRRFWQQINNRALLNQVTLQYLLWSPYSRCYDATIQMVMERWKTDAKAIDKEQIRFATLRRWREQIPKINQPKLSLAQLDLLRACWIKEELHQFYRLLETCFELWPAMQYRYEQAMVAEAAGEYKLAASLLESVVFWDKEREPNKFKGYLDEATDVFCCLALVRVYRRLHQYQPAWMLLEKVRQKDPHHRFLVGEEAMLYFQQHQYELAAEQFGKLYLLHADAQALVYRGLCVLGKVGDTAQAKAAQPLFDQAIQILDAKKAQSQKMAAVYGKYMARYRLDAFWEEWEMNRTLGLAYVGLARCFALQADRAKVTENLLRGYTLYHQLMRIPASSQKYGLAAEHKLGHNYHRLFFPDSPFSRDQLRQYQELAPFLADPDLQLIPQQQEIVW